MQKFGDVLSRWERKELSALEAGEILGCSERQFRRYRGRYEEEGLEGLLDRRLGKASAKRVPVDRIAWMLEQYRTHYSGWNVKHFHEQLQRHGFEWGYTWTKTQLHAAGLVERARRRGAHRRKRPRKPCIGMMLHQDASRFAWLEAEADLDLVVTMDDATSEVYSAFLVEEEGTASSFRGLLEVFAARGLPSSLYTDRGGHYFFTPKAGEAVDKDRPTQVGRALARLGIEHIPAYSPEARGRSGARSACSARCRTDCPRNSNLPASEISRPPTASSARSTCRRTTPASPGRPRCLKALSCRPLARSFARSCVAAGADFGDDAAAAEDIVSEVFLQVWRQAARFEGRSQVLTWLLAITRYKALSAIKGAPRDQVDVRVAEESADPGEGPEAAVHRKDIGAILRRCLGQLSLAHREVIDLVYYHERSVAEAAAIMNVPPNTVKTRMFYARRQLAELLSAAGVDSAASIKYRFGFKTNRRIHPCRNIADVEGVGRRQCSKRLKCVVQLGGLEPPTS